MGGDTERLKSQSISERDGERERERGADQHAALICCHETDFKSKHLNPLHRTTSHFSSTDSY